MQAADGPRVDVSMQRASSWYSFAVSPKPRTRKKRDCCCCCYYYCSTLDDDPVLAVSVMVSLLEEAW